MAERPIVIYGDPVLREVTHPVDEIDREVKDLVSDMVDTLKSVRGLGLAASQVGAAKRLFIVDLTAIDVNGSLKVFINPEIIETEGEIEMEEGCLSFPDMYLKITRPERVKVRATDLEGNRFEMSADGVTARAILHEYDHTQGKLFVDYLSPLARTLIRGRLRKLAAAS
ncbi:MAG: peptide deformylase [candidate division Zixibacteria bacterium]|nr:peptide deformylase [candidate division Zixibacteria bacterium]